MLTSITRNRKLVPHLLCSLELARTLSTVSGSPCSTQLMHLCSAPWYINVLWISFILEIRSIYPINNASFTNASTIVTANSEAPTLLQRLARAYGSNIKAATDTTIETATVTYNSHLNCLSSFAFFAASSSSERAAFFSLKKFEGTLKEDNYEKRKGFFKKLKDTPISSAEDTMPILTASG